MRSARRYSAGEPVFVPPGEGAPPGVRGSLFDAISPAMLAAWLARPDRNRQIDRPEPGFWLLHPLVKGGMRVPACIRIVHTTHEPGLPDNLMDRSPFLAGFIIDKGKESPVSLAEVWSRRGDPIAAGDYAFHVDDRKHARAYRPRDPVGQSAWKQVDWFDVPPPQWENK
jgi:hypothetical protein